MDPMVFLLDEYVIKAITMTEEIIAQDVNIDQLDNFTANRERLFSIIDQMSRQIEWPKVEMETRNEISRKIDFIKKLDEKLLTKLQEHRIEVKRDIEKTFKQKENVKGYNLSNVK